MDKAGCIYIFVCTHIVHTHVTIIINKKVAINLKLGGMGVTERIKGKQDVMQ